MAAVQESAGRWRHVVVGVDGSPNSLAALRRAARSRLSLGGIEAGSWLLARAGLLDGFSATTHWEDLDEFAAACI